MLEAQLEVVVDGLIGDLAQQCQVRHADLLLLGALKGGLLDLRLARLPPVAHVGDRFGAPKAATLLLPTNGAS